MNIFKTARPHHDAIRNAPPSRKAAYENLTATLFAPSSNNTVADNIGIGGKNSILDQPIVRIKAENETIVGNGKNSFIVIGKDREHIRNSGTNAISGNIDTNSIDLVVGLGYNPDKILQESKYVKGKGVNPDLIHDKARVYISEAVNVDKVFGIEKYVKSVFSVTDEQHLLSSVVAKADTIRVLGRTGVKIIAGSILDTDSAQSYVPVGGVELIHTNGGTLQSMVLGENLVNTLNDIILHINKLNTRLTSHVMQQIVWDTRMASHVHLNVLPNTPDPALFSGLIPKLIKNVDVITKSELDKQINSAVTKAKMKSISSDSILSSYHKLN